MRISCCSSDVCSSDLCSARSSCISRLKGIFAPSMRAVPERHHRQSAMKEKRNDDNLRRCARSVRASSAWPDRSHSWPERWGRSEEHTSELQSLMGNSYADFCLQKQTAKILITSPKIQTTHGLDKYIDYNRNRY